MTDMTLPEGRISIGQACRLLGVSATTLRKWIADGRLEAVRTPGGHRRVTAASVRAHVQAQLIWDRAQAGQDLPPQAPCDVLLVEADEVAALYLRRLLDALAPGLVLRRVRDGMSGYRAIAAHRPRLVIADLGAHPPDGSWLAWVLYLDNSTRSIPVVVTTGHPAQAVPTRAELPPELPVLHKPLDPQQLQAALQAALATPS